MVQARAFAGRMRERMATLGLTREALAVRSDASTKSIQNWANPNNHIMPGGLKLTKLADALETTPSWLVEGKHDLQRPTTTTLIRPGPFQPQDEGGHMVALVEVAGENGRAVRDLEAIHKWVVPADLIPRSTVTPPDMLRIVPVLGDSALPMLRPGTRVLVDLTDTNPAFPGMFLIRNEAGHRIMRLEYLNHVQPPVVRCAPVNPAYTTFDMDPALLMIEGRILGYWAET